MKKTRDLETLKDVLWTAFEEACAKHPHTSDYKSDGLNEKMESRNTLARIAQAIVAVESEQRIQAESAAAGPSLLKKPANAT